MMPVSAPHIDRRVMLPARSLAVELRDPVDPVDPVDPEDERCFMLANGEGGASVSSPSSAGPSDGLASMVSPSQGSGACPAPSSDPSSG
jgi:hypothetical protein